MLRVLGISLVVIAAVIVGDIVFRTSLLRAVRPVIVEPTDGQTVSAPVRLHWEGPAKMRVILRYAGRQEWDLGERESPIELPQEHLDGRGLYSVEVVSPTFGSWVSASRSFAVVPKSGRAEREDETRDGADVGGQLANLEDRLEELKANQEDMRDENTDLYEENATVREENAILTEELNRITESEQRALGQVTGMERRYGALLEEHRALQDEAIQLRERLSAVVPCSVWGYFSYVSPNTTPPTRRIVTVSTTRGDVFRTEAQCERIRRRDPSQASPCFCVGQSFGREEG